MLFSTHETLSGTVSNVWRTTASSVMPFIITVMTGHKKLHQIYSAFSIWLRYLSRNYINQMSANICIGSKLAEARDQIYCRATKPLRILHPWPPNSFEEFLTLILSVQPLEREEMAPLAPPVGLLEFVHVLVKIRIPFRIAVSTMPSRGMLSATANQPNTHYHIKRITS